MVYIYSFMCFRVSVPAFSLYLFNIVCSFFLIFSFFFFLRMFCSLFLIFVLYSLPDSFTSFFLTYLFYLRFSSFLFLIFISISVFLYYFIFLSLLIYIFMFLFLFLWFFPLSPPFSSPVLDCSSKIILILVPPVSLPVLSLSVLKFSRRVYYVFSVSAPSYERHFYFRRKLTKRLKHALNWILKRYPKLPFFAIRLGYVSVYRVICICFCCCCLCYE